MSLKKLKNDTYFSVFPFEIFIKIFKLISIKSVFLTLSKVNKYFRTLINDWTFFDRICFELNIYKINYIESYKENLNSPELKYTIVIEPCNDIIVIIKELKSSPSINVVNEIYDIHKLNENDRSYNGIIYDKHRYCVFEPDLNKLNHFISLIHDKYKLQIPPFFQQLGSLISHIGPIVTYFDVHIEPYGSLHEKDISENEDISENKDIKKNEDISENKDISENEDIDEDDTNNFNNYIPHLLEKYSLLLFGFFDWAGHGEGGECMLSINLYKDICKLNYINLVENSFNLFNEDCLHFNEDELHFNNDLNIAHKYIVRLIKNILNDSDWDPYNL